LVTQQAINVLTICEMATADKIFTPHSLLPHAKPSHSPRFEHYASPMVHPVTGKTISSYKKLMNNPATAEVWQTAFSQVFVVWHKDVIKPFRREQTPFLS
jgi:hypothetical protein